jgi:hypothetical protein
MLSQNQRSFALQSSATTAPAPVYSCRRMEQSDTAAPPPSTPESQPLAARPVGAPVATPSSPPGSDSPLSAPLPLRLMSAFNPATGHWSNSVSSRISSANTKALCQLSDTAPLPHWSMSVQNPSSCTPTAVNTLKPRCRAPRGSVGSRRSMPAWLRPGRRRNAGATWNPLVARSNDGVAALLATLLRTPRATTLSLLPLIVLLICYIAMRTADAANLMHGYDGTGALFYRLAVIAIEAAYGVCTLRYLRLPLAGPAALSVPACVTGVSAAPRAAADMPAVATAIVQHGGEGPAKLVEGVISHVAAASEEHMPLKVIVLFRELDPVAREAVSQAVTNVLFYTHADLEHSRLSWVEEVMMETTHEEGPGSEQVGAGQGWGRVRGELSDEDALLRCLESVATGAFVATEAHKMLVCIASASVVVPRDSYRKSMAVMRRAARAVVEAPLDHAHPPLLADPLDMAGLQHNLVSLLLLAHLWSHCWRTRLSPRVAHAGCWSR